MKMSGIFRLTVLSLVLTPAGGYAFSPIDAAPAPLLRVARSAPIAPVERLRIIPEDAKKGVMWPPQGRRVRINDNIMMLAPGATIRDMNNRMILPNTLRRPKKIRYTLDLYGHVRRIWISPTGEYMGRHRPAEPAGPYN